MSDDPSRRRPHGDERRRRRESQGEDRERGARRPRRESHTDDRDRKPRKESESRNPYEQEGRRRKGHRATDSQGDLLPRPSRQQSDSEWDSSTPRKSRNSRRNSTTDGSSGRASAQLSLDALAKLDKANAKKATGWGAYDYDEEYLREVRRKEKMLEKNRVQGERANKKKDMKKEEEMRRAAESDAALKEEEARRKREERRKARESRRAQTDDEKEKRRSAQTDDEREERRVKYAATATPSERDVKREKRRQEKQHRTEQKKRRVVSGPLAEEGGIDDDEYQYMMEKRGGAGSSVPTVYTEEELAKRKKWKRIIIGVVSAVIVLIIIVVVAVLVSKKSSTPASSSSSSSASTGGGSKSNLDGKDPNSVPTADKGGILDPWSWYDTTDFNVTYTSATVGGLPIMGLNSTWNDDVQANSHVPNLKESFKYGTMPIRGVNVGGWLNIEPFITPSFFSSYGSKDNIVDEWTLTTKLGSASKSTLEKHYATFITKQTFADIRAAGMDHVRFPFGYWIVQVYDGDPYVPQVAWRYLLRGIEYCRQNGLRVNLDLHGAPGSQNGWNHSGRQGVIGWLNGTDGDTNAQRTLDIHHKLSVFFAQPRYKNVVTMYGLVNEPRNVELDTAKVVAWSQKAITQVRADNITGIIVFGDGFMGLDNWQGKLQGNKNVLLDVHQYVIFNTDQLSLKHRDKLNFACEAWTQQSLRSMDTTTGFGPTMCGEWSQADTDCTQYINNVNRGTRWEGTFDTGNASSSVLVPQCPEEGKCDCGPANSDPSTYSDVYKKWLYQFAIAQMDSFEAGWGWFYWTWETEKATQWSYRRGIAAGILPKTAYDRDWTCPSDATKLDSFSGLEEYY
ncbi:glycoside hydrolase family 5 protein [Dothidotthia symphoricarpi CBS 119687]|uniref:glucan 1,3-beta-glucosidase n=1 Tax=Dothidotthia symphoricarpi CBS 119687 TaxID=1392245 RepID=A0A6A5ZWP9_9PLEO|nr:glycoside hydrolase family 5 protein [Dothidotthia symphoricarpi CBS 119687]KAF2123959.1 glycoside hydrolase family 5 protein [Dothidotthia symphoricarpi CBS 119687]